ncbi:hypothetical protein AA971_06255 [Helicobacter pylori]|nr:hypothetical protein AA971_06255 [Helicobacter pylori]
MLSGMIAVFFLGLAEIHSQAQIKQKLEVRSADISVINAIWSNSLVRKSHEVPANAKPPKSPTESLLFLPKKLVFLSLMKL